VVLLYFSLLYKGFALNSTIIDALMAIDMAGLSSRQEADEILSLSIPEAGIRHARL